MTGEKDLERIAITPSVPYVLCYLRNRIVEHLPLPTKGSWLSRFDAAIQSRQNLHMVHWDFMLWFTSDSTINRRVNRRQLEDQTPRLIKIVDSIRSGVRIDDGYAGFRALAWFAVWTCGEKQTGEDWQVMADKLISLIEVTK